MVKKRRNRATILELAASCLDDAGRNPKLIEDVRNIARMFRLDDAARERAKPMPFDKELRRIEHQRNLFAQVYPSTAKDRLRDGLLARAREILLEQGDGEAADAILEFLPSADAERLLDQVFAEIDP